MLSLFKLVHAPIAVILLNDHLTGPENRYVVKTYPSIDPHKPPPPHVLLILYKCQNISSRVVT